MLTSKDEDWTNLKKLTIDFAEKWKAQVVLMAVIDGTVEYYASPPEPSRLGEVAVEMLNTEPNPEPVSLPDGYVLEEAEDPLKNSLVQFNPSLASPTLGQTLAKDLDDSWQMDDTWQAEGITGDLEELGIKTDSDVSFPTKDTDVPDVSEFTNNFLMVEVAEDPDMHFKQEIVAEDMELSQAEQTEKKDSLIESEIAVRPKMTVHDCRYCEKSFTAPYQLAKHEQQHEGVRPFECELCRKTFTSQIDLDKHKQVHSSDRPFKCQFCPKTFKRSYTCSKHESTVHTMQKLQQCPCCDYVLATRELFNEHIRDFHADAYPYECIVCNRLFRSQGGLQRHARMHNEDRPFKCETCSKGYRDEKDLKLHLLTHSDDRPFPCRYCDKSFKQLSHLTKHETTHTEREDAYCEICQRTFTTRDNLLVHIRIKHDTGPPYTCSVCSETYQTMGELEVHREENEHREPSKTNLQCKYCLRMFADLAELREHQSTHKGPLRFLCNVCQQKFDTKAHLTRHMRVHTGEKPYACDVCNKRFSDTSNLLKHQTVHTGKKKYSCQYCQRQFGFSSALKSHERLHLGIKPYSCKVCKKRFTQAGAAAEHELGHSGVRYLCSFCVMSFKSKVGLKNHEKTHKEREKKEREMEELAASQVEVLPRPPDSYVESVMIIEDSGKMTEIQLEEQDESLEVEYSIKDDSMQQDEHDPHGVGMLLDPDLLK